MEPIVLDLFGGIPSKKNNYRPRKGGKGFFKDADLQAKLDYLMLQIPAELRGLQLIHPDIQFEFTVPTRAQDRDNMAQCALDILVLAGVLKNDNIASCNGRIIIEPATIDPCPHARITITPREGI